MAATPDGQQRPRERKKTTTVEGGLSALANAFAERQAQPPEETGDEPADAGSPSSESKKDQRNRKRREQRAQKAAVAAGGAGADPQPTGSDKQSVPERLDYSAPKNNLGRVFSVESFINDEGQLLAPVLLEDGKEAVDVKIIYPAYTTGDDLPENTEQIRIVRYDNPSFAGGVVRYFAVLESFKENYLTIEARKEDEADVLLPGDRLANIQLLKNQSPKARSPFLFEQSRFGQNERFYIEGGLSNIPTADDIAALTDQFTIEVVRCLGPREQRNGQQVVEYQAVIVARGTESFDPAVLRNELNTKEDRLRAERIRQLPETTVLDSPDFVPADRRLPLERYNNKKEKKHPLNGSFIHLGQRDGRPSFLAVRPLLRLFETNSTEPLQQIVGQDIAVVGQLQISRDRKAIYDGLFRHDIEFVQLVSQYEQLLRAHEAILRAVSSDASAAAVEIQRAREAVIETVSTMSFGFDGPEMIQQALRELKTHIKQLQATLEKNDTKIPGATATTHHEQDIFLFELGEFEKRFPLSNADLHTQRVELYARSIEGQIDPEKADQLNAIYSDIANLNHRNDLDRHARIRGLLEWAKAYGDRYPAILAQDFKPSKAVAEADPAGTPKSPDAVTAETKKDKPDPAVPPTVPVAPDPAASLAQSVPDKKRTGPFVFNEDAQSDTAAVPQPPFDDLQDTTARDASQRQAPEQPTGRPAEKTVIEQTKKPERPPQASPLERLLQKMGVAANFPVDKALAAGKMTLALVGGLVSYSGGPDKPDIYPVAFDIHGLQWDDEKPDDEAKVHMTERYASPKGGLAPGGKPVIRPISLFKKFGPFRLLKSTPIPAPPEKLKPIPEELRVDGGAGDLKRWTTDMTAGYNEWVVPPTSFVAQEPAPQNVPVTDDPEIELYNPPLLSDERQNFIDRALTPPVPPLDTTSFVKQEKRPARTTERPIAAAEARPAAKEAAPVSAGLLGPAPRRPRGILPRDQKAP